MTWRAIKWQYEMTRTWRNDGMNPLSSSPNYSLCLNLFPELLVFWPVSSLATSSLSSYAAQCFSFHSCCNALATYLNLSSVCTAVTMRLPSATSNCSPIAGRSHHQQITIPRAVVTMCLATSSLATVSSTSQLLLPLWLTWWGETSPSAFVRNLEVC